MPKFKTFIVENDEGPLKSLLRQLQPFPNVIDLDTINIARSFREAQLIILNGSSFDLSILDKALDAGKTCFDLISEANKKSFGIIVLNTKNKTSQKYFEETRLLNNYFFLRKPYNEEDIATLIERLRQVDDYVNTPQENDKPLWIRETTKEFPISQDRIVYIEVKNATCIIYYTYDKHNTQTQFCSVTNPLKYYHSILNKNLFCRISERHMINMSFLKELSFGVITLNAQFNNVDIKLPLPEKNRTLFTSQFIK